jgi:hypothetical protein
MSIKKPIIRYTKINKYILTLNNDELIDIEDFIVSIKYKNHELLIFAFINFFNLKQGEEFKSRIKNSNKIK